MMHTGETQPWLYITEGFQADSTPEQHLDITVPQIHAVNSLVVQKANKHYKSLRKRTKHGYAAA